MLSLQACGDEPLAEQLCGPCGSLESGQLSIAGNAQIDGFFAATHRFQGATAQIKTDFDADIRALAEVWGYGEADAEIDADFVAGLVGEIKAQIAGSIDADAGLKVTIVPAKCEASVDVAVEAQASCEVQADCEVEVDPGQASVACEGTCSGSCSGSCSGDLSCAVKTPTVNCEGQCGVVRDRGHGHLRRHVSWYLRRHVFGDRRQWPVRRNVRWRLRRHLRDHDSRLVHR